MSLADANDCSVFGEIPDELGVKGKPADRCWLTAPQPGGAWAPARAVHPGALRERPGSGFDGSSAVFGSRAQVTSSNGLLFKYPSVSDCSQWKLLASDWGMDLALQFEEWNNCLGICPAYDLKLKYLLVIELTSRW